jgi:hypothetical protein
LHPSLKTKSDTPISSFKNSLVHLRLNQYYIDQEP